MHLDETFHAVGTVLLSGAQTGGDVVARRATLPTTGDHPSTMLFMMPVPRVSVRNWERKPMSPRAGIRNSSRTRPLPLLTIFVIVPRRSPTCAITMP